MSGTNDSVGASAGSITKSPVTGSMSPALNVPLPDAVTVIGVGPDQSALAVM